jgi:type I restriction enzyme, S subunit
MNDVVPCGWDIRPLSELASIDSETLAAGTDPAYEFRYIDIASVKTGRIHAPSEAITFSSSPSRARKVVRKGDVLMSTVRPNLQAFAYFDEASEDFVASTGFAVLRAKHISDGRFLYQSILGDDVTRQIAALVAGSNYPAISSANVKDIEVLAPPLPEQKKSPPSCPPSMT